MKTRHCLAAALLLMLSACGQASAPAPSSETTATTSEAAPPPATETSTPATDTAVPTPDTTTPAPVTDAENETPTPAPTDSGAQPAPPPPPAGAHSGPTAAPSLPSSSDEGEAFGSRSGAETGEEAQPPAGEHSGSTTSEPATILCEEVGRRTTQAECDDYKQLSASAQQGQAAFNAPDPMQRGQKVTLQLAIGYNPQSAAEPTPSQTVDSLPGETQAFTPQVGRFMAADLSGSGFNVRPLSNRSQEIMRGSVTTWEWEVTAVEGGSHTLTLRTVVEACPTPSTCVPLHSTTHDQAVTVKVGLMGQVQDLLEAIPTGMRLIAGVLAGLAALLSAVFGLRSALRKGRSDA